VCWVECKSQSEKRQKILPSQKITTNETMSAPSQQLAEKHRHPAVVIFQAIVFLAAFVCIVVGVVMRRDDDPSNDSTATILIVCGSAIFGIVGIYACCICALLCCAGCAVAASASNETF